MRSVAVTTLTLVAVLASMASPVWAQARCRVMDPTGTPLNVRTGPNGSIIDRLPNGFLVSIMSITYDRGGRPWALVSRFDNGRRIGWVYREFIACF
jgi:hypothetical protein